MYLWQLSTIEKKGTCEFGLHQNNPWMLNVYDILILDLCVTRSRDAAQCRSERLAEPTRLIVV
jgi:hypothetical protein